MKKKIITKLNAFITPVLTVNVNGSQLAKVKKSIPDMSLP